jgi:hypothetical protein
LKNHGSIGQNCGKSVGVGRDGLNLGIQGSVGGEGRAAWEGPCHDRAVESKCHGVVAPGGDGSDIGLGRRGYRNRGGELDDRSIVSESDEMGFGVAGVEIGRTFHGDEGGVLGVGCEIDPW